MSERKRFNKFSTNAAGNAFANALPPTKCGFQQPKQDGTTTKNDAFNTVFNGQNCRILPPNNPYLTSMYI